MKTQKSGEVINVSSVQGRKAVATGAVYCLTKHAVRAISEALRQEVKDYDIRVTTISPGAVRTVQRSERIRVSEGRVLTLPDIGKEEQNIFESRYWFERTSPRISHEI